ncbi:hypothetical protein [Enterobacter hormaechei]|uniref:hypothetical protein n=1 Tax=Enterobacter hormaechei TaxID=158836 RepID=UPI00287D7746|nr:hypothetical protein [Enterobacter hormaechei]MDS6634603.1 hypothetical protein [Enterobacter hormaechei]
METLTVQAYLNETWTDIALIKYPGSEKKDWNTTQLDYLTEYAINFLDYDDFHAVSVNHPVSLFLMTMANRAGCDLSTISFPPEQAAVTGLMRSTSVSYPLASKISYC